MRYIAKQIFLRELIIALMCSIMFELLVIVVLLPFSLGFNDLPVNARESYAFMMSLVLFFGTIGAIFFFIMILLEGKKRWYFDTAESIVYDSSLNGDYPDSADSDYVKEEYS